jgi:hypothetical protein
MDGRLGTDVAAPGEVSFGAYSPNSYYSSFAFNVIQNSSGNYGIQTAVSAAAPITAGVIALLLEANPQLTPAQIKTILQETARTDSFTGDTPNAVWGYGKLDALAAVNRAYQTVGIAEVRHAGADIQIFPNPFSDQLSIRVPDSFSTVREVRVYNLFGACVLRATGNNLQSVNVLGLAAGIYVLSIETATGTVSYRVVKS